MQNRLGKLTAPSKSVLAVLIMAADPVIGDWYRLPGGPMFEVVAIDEEDGTLEVQHFDGTVEELDLETWGESMFESVEPPEDYSGSFDMEKEDYFADQENGELNDYASALDFLDRAE